MAWNGFNHPSYNNPAASPFWDWAAAFDPNGAQPRGAGEGVDRAAAAATASPPFPPGFGAGFPFRGHGPWSRRGDGHGRHRHHPHRGGRHGRHGSSPPPPGQEPPSDTEMAVDAAAEENEKAPLIEKAALNEKDASPETLREATADDPPEVSPEEDNGPCGGERRGHHGCHGRRGHGRGGFGWGRGGFGGHHHPHHGPHGFGPFGPFGPHGHPFGPPPPPGPHGGAPGDMPPPPPYPEGPAGTNFDINAWMASLSNHPFAQQIRAQIAAMRQAAATYQAHAAATRNGPAGAAGAAADQDDVDSFVPPIDVFSAENAWTIHVALPGAKKEDVGVHWDADKGELGISGVVHRPGDEDFLRGMVSGERRVGLFRRSVKLPPAEEQRAQGEHEDVAVDEEGITARMEDGVLVVVVPKAEKGWTEVRKVDIE